MADRSLAEAMRDYVHPGPYQQPERPETPYTPELVERVALALRLAFAGLDGAETRDDWRAMASAALAVIAEETSK